ncbi:MAG: methyltransferase domain-containing protein [Caldilineaceae bacterium]
MSLTGPAFYDDAAVFATYQQRRQRPDSPNDTLEKPVMLDLIGDVTGLAVLDLGCGDAAFGQELLDQGAGQYVGVEGSQKMVELAQARLTCPRSQVVHQTLEDWNSPAAAFDLAVARLVLHYLADLPTLFTKIYNSLRPNGRFIFSVEHPVITSCDRGWPAGTMRQDWVVDQYFEPGLRVVNWMGGAVQKHHHTVEDYFMTLQQAGFVVEHLREATPRRALFQDEALYERRQRIPLFLCLAGRKPSE